jgi:hypothetical protein
MEFEKPFAAFWHNEEKCPPRDLKTTRILGLLEMPQILENEKHYIKKLGFDLIENDEMIKQCFQREIEMMMKMKGCIIGQSVAFGVILKNATGHNMSDLMHDLQNKFKPCLFKEITLLVPPEVLQEAETHDCSFKVE